MAECEWRQLNDRLFWFHPPCGGEVFVIRSDRGLLLVDSGMFRWRSAIVESIRESGLNPEQIELGVATHFHNDHVGALGWWRAEFDFKVIAHENGVAAMEGADRIATGSEMPFIGYDEPFVACKVDFPVSGGEKFQVGAEEIMILPAYGHTVASIHLLWNDIIFVGDTIFADGTIGWMDVHWGSHPNDYLETLTRLSEYCGCLCCASHGEPFTLTAELLEHAKSIVSFYLPLGHGMGSPRGPSRY